MSTNVCGVVVGESSAPTVALQLDVSLYPTADGWNIQWRRGSSVELREYMDGGKLAGVLFRSGICTAEDEELAKFLAAPGEVQQNAVGLRYMSNGDYAMIVENKHPVVSVSADDLPSVKKLWATKPSTFKARASDSWTELARTTLLTYRPKPVAIPESFYRRHLIEADKKYKAAKK